MDLKLKKISSRQKLIKCGHLIALLGILSPAGLPFRSALTQAEQSLYLPLIQRNHLAGPGTVTGKVVDAGNGQPVEGAEVCSEVAQCAVTNVEGDYIIENISAGSRLFTSVLEGFFPDQASASVRAYQTVTLNFALTPRLVEGEVEMQIILTWGSDKSWANPAPPPSSWPNDLDAHLWLTAPDPPTHIGYFNGEYSRGDCTTFPSSCQEVDRQFGSGPETIYVGSWENAKYYYGVLNYNQNQPGVPPITRTGARVRLYTESGFLNTFDVPTSGEGNFWYVFSVNGVSREISVANCIITYTGEIPVCP